ncbi:MAG TPA: hypothetical protein VF582_06825 [Allosphingosinicella sp.]|jgi:hypothetical protein
MRKVLLLALVGLAAAPAAAQAPLGVFFRWAAFERGPQRQCYAVAAPVRNAGPADGPAYASVGLWPERKLGPQLYLRLGGRRRAGSAVILRVDGRPFQLAGEGSNAWATNARADAAIVAAIRTGVTMTVETRSQGGGRIRDRYVLRGAASAIDAAAFACAARTSSSAGKRPD